MWASLPPLVEDLNIPCGGDELAHALCPVNCDLDVVGEP